MNRSNFVSLIAKKVSLPEETIEAIISDLADCGFKYRPIEISINALPLVYRSAYDALPEPYKSNPESLKLYLDENENLCAETWDKSEFLFWIRGETSFWGQISQ